MMSERQHVEASRPDNTSNPPPPYKEAAQNLFAYPGSTDAMDYFLGEVFNTLSFLL